jgi:type I restriction enzyme S subunit
MKWLSYILSSEKLRHTLSNLATGTSGSMKNITKGVLLSLKIFIPPLYEQKKIARVLSTWDKAIETVEKLIDNSKAQKKALMQQLLTGKRRLPKFDKEWKNTPLGKLIVESRISGTTGDIAQKITIKLYGQGVVPKNEKRPGSQSTRYYKRKSGQFIYSKLDFLNGAFGIIPKELDGFESTLDLPAFDFKTGVEPVWFINFVSREEFYSANLSLANGGRKARRVNPKDLLNLKVLLPSYPEQQKIASLLTTADKKIETLQQKLDYLKQEKNALMQQLLTGKRRVKADS